MKKLLTGVVTLIVSSQAISSEWFHGENLLTQPIPNEDGYTKFEKNEPGWKSLLWNSNKNSGKDTYVVNIVTEKLANLEEFRSSQDNPGKRACNSFSSTVLDGSDRNGYSSLLWETVCQINGTEIRSIQLGISGNDSLYHLRKLWKTAVSEEDASLWKSNLNDVSLCDTRSQEHPCPAGYERATPNK
jgi:hypothetical protein